MEAFKKIFGPSLNNTKNYPEIEWKNHIFCQKCVIAELCAWAAAAGGNGKDFMRTLDDLKSAPTTFSSNMSQKRSSEGAPEIANKKAKEFM